MSVARQLLFFMTSEDERDFSVQLKAHFPSTVILDDNIWTTAEPITVPSIDQCKSGFAHLWNKQLFPDLPVGRRQDGRFQGPSVGPVLQFVRCIQERDSLKSGRLAMGFDRNSLTSELDKYFKEVWRILKKPATSKLACVNPENQAMINPKVWGYWAWPGAVSWCQKTGRFLKDRASENYYLPARVD